MLSWKNLSQLLHQPNIKCHTSRTLLLQWFNKRILQPSRARVDVSWMKEDIVVRLASVTSLANYCEAAVWIFRHDKIEIKKVQFVCFQKTTKKLAIGIMFKPYFFAFTFSQLLMLCV